MRPLGRAARREQGVAAIELALIMTFFIALLPFVLLFGRAFLAYTTLQKSVHDAARYMATLPLAQMANADAVVQHSAFARQMVLEAMAETAPHMKMLSVSLDCIYLGDDYNCGTLATAPTQVRVKVLLEMPIDFMPDYASKWLPQLSVIPLQANAIVRYVN